MFNNHQMDLEEYQNYLEVSAYMEEASLRQEKNDSYIKNKTEYNFKYGHRAIEEIIPVAERYINDRFLRRNQHTVKFFWFHIKPAKEAFDRDRQDVSKSKFDKARDPAKGLAEVVAVKLVEGLSNGCAYVSMVAKIASAAMAWLQIPFHMRDELMYDAAKFFVVVLDHVAEKTTVFDKVQVDGRDYYLYPSEEWKEVIEEAMVDVGLSTGRFKPMVVPPKPHKNLVSGEGGYLQAQSPLLKYPVKIDGQIHKALLSFNSKTNPEFFEEINSIQETPYCVNVKLLDVIEEFYSKGFTFPGFPISTDDAETLYLSNKEITLRNEKRRKYAEAFEKEFSELKPSTVKHVISKYKNRDKNIVDGVINLLNQARMYAGIGRFYFPIFLDYRGRRYPYANTGLTYQGDEMSKALVLLADGEPLDENGLRALFETLGNTLGHDKKELDIKTNLAVEFWETNKETFLAGDFSMFFEEADKFDEPINALAVVLELVEFDKDPLDYTCGYIAHRDARCSGPSIVGTVLHDKQIMEMTSVVDYVKDGKLCDAYGSAAFYGHEATKALAAKGNKACLDLLEFEDQLFSRSAFKFPVMGISYGVTDYGNKEHTKSLLNWEEELSLDHKAVYDKLVKKAIEHALPTCSMFLEKIKEVGKALVKRDGYICYTNPITGFPIVNKEFKAIDKRIDILDGFNRTTITWKVYTDKIDTSGMANSFSPGFIHSFDAALLSLVKCACPFDLSLIHDSIGAHPNNVHKVVEAYGKAMNLLYQNNVFKQVLDELDVGIKLEPINTYTGPLPLSRHILV